MLGIYRSVLCLMFLCLSVFSTLAQVQKGKDIYGKAMFDNIGRIVSLSSDGNVVAIAAWGDIYGCGMEDVKPCYASVYEWDGEAWKQRGTNILGDNKNVLIGYSLSLSAKGDVLAVGTKSAYSAVYDWNGINWIQRGQNIVSDSISGCFGYPVSLSSDGNIVAIGASCDSEKGKFAGKVRVYKWNEKSWKQLGGDIEGEVGGYFFGESLVLSSDGLVVGVGSRSKEKDWKGTGRLKVYEWDGKNWKQRGKSIDAIDKNNINFDDSGISVSLSSDGSIVAIGEPKKDKTGHVRIYKWTGVKWKQLGDNIQPKGERYFFGSSISLSSDGKKLAVGIPYSSLEKASLGYVRVYKWNGKEWGTEWERSRWRMEK